MYNIQTPEPKNLIPQTGEPGSGELYQPLFLPSFSNSMEAAGL